MLRRALVPVLALTLLLGAFAPLSAAAPTPTKSQSPGNPADTKKSLAKAKKELDDLVAKINREQRQLDSLQARLRAAQADLNKSAEAIDAAQSQYGLLEGKVQAIRQAYDDTRARYRRVRDQLNARARQAYEEGPAAEFSFLLTSQNLGDLSDRMEFIGRLAQDDATLAADVQNQANALAARKSDLQDLLNQQAQTITELNNQEKVLDAKFNAQQQLVDEQNALVDSLDTDRAQATALINRLEKKLKAQELAAARAATHGGPTPNDGPGPLFVCPVDQPRGYGDSFGAPRYAGGFHPHAGNDILAPEGTPIRATFDGVASEDPNGLGGNAVIVKGAEGWTYNAHMVRYGTLGQVTTGTIIGYVGNTGDAAGGPTHDHFEWHPNVIPANPYRSAYGYTVIGSAIDPYPYLNEVC
ncbi:MAG TPA: peptidoglycan DD-metalloendopeptidase family protein [Actinomycetota bacterium]